MGSVNLEEGITINGRVKIELINPKKKKKKKKYKNSGLVNLNLKKLGIIEATKEYKENRKQIAYYQKKIIDIEKTLKDLEKIVKYLN